VDVAGTTGAGDCAIAGFIYGLRRGFPPSACLRAATAVGACNVECPDTTTGILPWEAVEERFAAGWLLHPAVADFAAAGWREDDDGTWQPC